MQSKSGRICYEWLCCKTPGLKSGRVQGVCMRAVSAQIISLWEEKHHTCSAVIFGFHVYIKILHMDSIFQLSTGWAQNTLWMLHLKHRSVKGAICRSQLLTMQRNEFRLAIAAVSKLSTEHGIQKYQYILLRNTSKYWGILLRQSNSCVMEQRRKQRKNGYIFHSRHSTREAIPEELGLIQIPQPIFLYIG